MVLPNRYDVGEQQHESEEEPVPGAGEALERDEQQRGDQGRYEQQLREAIHLQV